MDTSPSRPPERQLEIDKLIEELVSKLQERDTGKTQQLRASFSSSKFQSSQHLVCKSV
jgi:hypothetical protein